MTPTCRVLLVEDHEIFRKGLRALLEADGRILIVGEASDGRDAVIQAAALTPDVAILDLSMPGMNGTEAVPLILKRSAKTKIVVLTANNALEYVRATLDAGASAYVLKEDSHQDLISAINSALAGKVFLSPGIHSEIVTGFTTRAPKRNAGLSGVPLPLDALTVREREVLKLIAEGRSNKEMADVLHISVKTVEKHRASAMKKIGAKRAADVTAYAIRHGVVST
jgi:DNA-binding NarL/FixJ family response regulator